MYHCELFDRPPNVILSADPALNPDNYAVLTVFLSLKEDKVIGLALDFTTYLIVCSKTKTIIKVEHISRNQPRDICTCSKICQIKGKLLWEVHDQGLYGFQGTIRR